MSDPTRPIIGIENRTAQEVFDIMCDRLRAANANAANDALETAAERLILVFPISGKRYAEQVLWLKKETTNAE